MSTINSIPFRSTIFYRTDGTVAPIGTVFTISTNGLLNFSNSLSLNTLTASSITGNITTLSSITASTILTTGNNIALGQSVAFPNRYLELGTDVVDSVYLDFHSKDSTLSDYSTRIQSLNGATVGSGGLNMYASTMGLMANVGIGTTIPQATLHVQGGTLVTNPTVYNTNVGGWFIIGYWDCSAAQNSGAHLKLRIMGCNGYDNTGGTLNQMGGETTIYLNNLNNLNTTTNANVDGLWKHEGGQAPFTSVKAVQGSSRYQYFIYASVQSYTQHSITAETTQGTIWTSQFTSTTDPGANSLTVRVLTLSTAAVGTNVGIGTTTPAGTLHVYGVGVSSSYTSYQVSIENSSSVRNLLIGVDGVSASLQSVVNLTTTPSSAWLTLNPLGGNVGIGTNSPNAIFHIYDAAASSPSIPFMALSPNLPSNGAQFLYFGKANSNNNTAQIGWFNIADGSASNYAVLQIYGRANIMTWQASTGNVGIGTTNPAVALHVMGSILGSSFSSVSGTVNANPGGSVPVYTCGDYQSGFILFRWSNGYAMYYFTQYPGVTSSFINLICGQANAYTLAAVSNSAKVIAITMAAGSPNPTLVYWTVTSMTA